ncbi:RDD family protein [Oxalicibacterium faecigallinarum]|uniref:RDD family protein n=1 Tax=Oxalicibacterium faecigallinarum TaxID=573741 RepID=A0A8J3F0L9_9BURK|nr:RDD family protein [Oxalicibacterium faecigallinarum]GGI16114.1 RDD family protein [Oxalicibacterium faecigallinarum]
MHSTPSDLPPPTIKRRLTVMLYEAVLLFGVIAIAGLLFSITFQQRHALYLRHASQAWLFVVVGAYFVWFWMHGGQTLPMKTWRMQLVTTEGHALPLKRAIARYLLAWLWFLPGLMIAWLLDAKPWMAIALVSANMLAWALSARLHPSRQFLHDRIVGTQIVQHPKHPPQTKP